MSRVKYSKDHEWVKLDDAGNALVGITFYAQKQLGDVVYVELPESGRTLQQDENAAVVESVKAASDVKAPIGGSVLEINPQLNDHPEIVNSDPMGSGWFMKLSPANPSELDQLMDETAYNSYLKTLGYEE
ncbi:MAG: glycine cleavage system protein GcvH [Burkholderiales bacterium]